MKFIGTSPLALVFVLSLGPVLDAQDLFSGDWRGTVEMARNSQKHAIRVLIKGNEADNYFCEDDKWRNYEVGPRSFFKLRKNALLAWIDQGGLWTETQVFSLSHVNHNTLAFTWTRQVHNINEEGTDDETWHTFGHGTLKRSAADQKDKCETIPLGGPSDDPAPIPEDVPIRPVM